MKQGECAPFSQWEPQRERNHRIGGHAGVHATQEFVDSHAGEPGDDARRVYELVLEAQLAGLGAVAIGRAVARHTRLSTRAAVGLVATVAVLGQTVKGVLFPDGSDPVGQYILINNVPFLVIGVMTPKGASANGNDSDDVVFVPLTTGLLRVSSPVI